MPNISFEPSLPTPPGLPGFGQTGITNFSGVNPPAPLPDPVLDEVGSLYPMSLTAGGPTDAVITFPMTQFTETLSKDLAIYKFINRNGARIDNMGSNPPTWKVRGIFTNHIWPGPSERGIPGQGGWQYGQLFPKNGVFNGNTTFEKMLTLLNNTSGNLWMMHPLLGRKSVQLQSYEYQFMSNQVRDGAYLDMTFIETVPDTALASNLTNPPSVTSVANRLNVAFSHANNVVPTPPGLSLSQFFGQVAGFVHAVTQYPNQIVSAINSDTLVLTATTNVFSNFNTNLNLNGSFVLTAPTVNISLTTGIGIISGSSVSAFTAGAALGGTYPFNQSQRFATVVPQKQAPLGSPLNPYANSSSGTVPNFTSTSQTQAYSQSAQALKAANSLLSLNNNPSKNATTFINKCITATYDLLQYYISLNLSSAASIISNLQQMMYALQVTQNSLNATNSNKGVLMTYVPPSNISWIQLSNVLNNQLDDLFNLNSIANDNYLFVQGGTEITYWQAA